ncbi:MAG: hypothetical protein ACR2JG_13110, partial [Geodermatophilaceae bacterium]
RHTPIPVEEAFVLTDRDRVAVAAAEADTDESGVAAPNRRMSRLHARASAFYNADVTNPPDAGEIEEAQHHGGRRELDAAPEGFRGVSETGIPKDH